VLLPNDMEDLQDAVNVVEHQNALYEQVAGGIGMEAPIATSVAEGHMREILVSSSMPDKCREWARGATASSR